MGKGTVKMVEKTDNLFKGLYGKLVFGNEEFKEKIKNA